MHAVRLRSMLLFAGVFAAATAYTYLVDPCIWVQHNMIALRDCRAEPYLQQLDWGAYLYPNIFGFFAVLTGGWQVLLHWFFGPPGAVDLVVEGDRIVVCEGEEVRFEARGEDTKIMVEGADLVLIRVSDEHMVELATDCTDDELRHVAMAVGKAVASGGTLGRT